jgi:hypothetical protein
MQGWEIIFLELIILITYGKSASCCLCPELVFRNVSYFCGQELRGSDCQINAKFICDAGSATAIKAEANCNGMTSSTRNSVPPSYQHCKKQRKNSTVMLAYCLRLRFCFDLKRAKNFWKNLQFHRSHIALPEYISRNTKI